MSCKQTISWMWVPWPTVTKITIIALIFLALADTLLTILWVQFGVVSYLYVAFLMATRIKHLDLFSWAWPSNLHSPITPFSDWVLEPNIRLKCFPVCFSSPYQSAAILWILTLSPHRRPGCCPFQLSLHLYLRDSLNNFKHEPND